MAGSQEMCEDCQSKLWSNCYKNIDESEALGLSTALSKQYKVVVMYKLDYVLPQVVKLSNTLQTEHLDLSVVCILVNNTLQTLDECFTISKLGV